MRLRGIGVWGAVWLLLSACSPQAPATSPRMPSPKLELGGWKPADPFSEEVQEAARFAVQKQAVAEHSRLIYKDVQSAQIQIVAGLNFQMKLIVIENGASKFAVATVWRNTQNQYTLTQWHWSLD
jgi:hypothetical protein